MIERSLQLDSNNAVNGARCAARPTDLPTENRRWIRHRQLHLNPIDFSNYSHSELILVAAQSFPTPMEEPKKILKAQYMGSTEVLQPTGMEVLNTAIETALRELKPEKWESVNVAVAPSMISIHSSDVSIQIMYDLNDAIEINILSIRNRDG